jgi:hypothetical protein
MACLPTRVQLVLWNRLKLYNCVFSPDTSSTFGGVCISSGGSYKQLCDWYYNTASFFEASFLHSKLHPVIYCVSGASDSLLANGYYLKTSHEFNKFPVYAQLNQDIVISKPFSDAIASASLLAELRSKAPNFAFKSLRAGERLLVRQKTGWAVQSVSAFRGHLQTDGDCGFHVLYFPDKDKKEKKTLSVKTFAGMNQDLKTIKFKDCSTSKLLPIETSSSLFTHAATFTFNFGSKRCVECTAVPGRDYCPASTKIQQMHADGPWTYDAATDWRPIHPDVLHRTSENIQPLPACDFISLLLSLSALLAFFPFTAVGTARKNDKGRKRSGSLKVPIDLGRGCVFRFDWLHHGWSCCDARDSKKLPVHFRAHFYMLSGLLRDLPVQDLESMFEFLSALSHDEMDEGTRLLLLECLQTFVPWRHPNALDDFTRISSDELARERGYSLFDSQQALDDHISKLRNVEHHKKRRRQ